MKKVKICQNCKRNYALLSISTKQKQALYLCLDCYNEKVKLGELPSIGEMDKNDVAHILNSLPKDTSEGGKGGSAVAVKSTNPALFVLKFGRDLTHLASMGKIDPVIGRKKEIERAVRILSRRIKNNPVFVGEPGVGKTAIAEGLALRIANGNVPEKLKDKRIVMLDIASVVAGTKYRGEFEDRLKKILEEVMEEKNIILFVDELHTIIGAGGAEGAIDASNILKPSLSRGEIQLIGATTLEEYRKYIERDAALERRFQSVNIGEPNIEEAIEIMTGLKNKYEQFHEIDIEQEAIIASVVLSEKYINDRYLPDKAIDLIDEACAKKKIELNTKSEEIAMLEEELSLYLDQKEEAVLHQDFEMAKTAYKGEEKTRKKLNKAIELDQANKETRGTTIRKEDIALIVEEWTGIPASSMTKEDREKLKTLREDLVQFVKGQDEAVDDVVRAIRRSKVGLKDPNRPAGVFLLLGPTGVGKTELAKSIAKVVYGTEKNMIRFDMSEFMEKHTVSKLVGAPPGYVGYEDEGKLTKLLRRNPYSIVLFDEVEKAHPDVMNIMLQIFEDGRITDSKGRVISAKNAIFIMTSNAGSDVYAAGKEKLGFSSSVKEINQDLRARVRESIKKNFRPEFLNRVDDILIFNKLTAPVMDEIAEKMIFELKDLLATQGIELKVAKGVIEHLSKLGFDPEYGARTLRREMLKIKDHIASVLIEKDDVEKVSLSVKENSFVVR